MRQSNKNNEKLKENSRSKKPDTYLINHQVGQPEIYWDDLMKIRLIKT